MKTVKKIIKNNKKLCLGIILGVVLSSISVYAASTINSSDVSYSNSSLGISSTNVKDAIDELAKKAKTNCPEGYMCSKVTCKRATKLHTDTCNNSSTIEGCLLYGDSIGDTITYGNLGTDGILTSGDAFNCDVNGDGEYDENTERFYYVTDLESNSDYAVLIYYSNVSEGVASSKTTYAYDSVNKKNLYGPITAIEQLPTTSQWSNVSLYKTTRVLTYENGENTSGDDTLSPSISYDGYAARLLTYQEVYNTCNASGTTSLNIKECIYMFENSSYSASSNLGYWLETPYSTTNAFAWYISGGLMSIVPSGGVIYYDNFNGVRPVIEVLKDEISY